MTTSSDRSDGAAREAADRSVYDQRLDDLEAMLQEPIVPETWDMTWWDSCVAAHYDRKYPGRLTMKTIGNLATLRDEFGLDLMSAVRIFFKEEYSQQPVMPADVLARVREVRKELRRD